MIMPADVHDSWRQPAQVELANHRAVHGGVVRTGEHLRRLLLVLLGLLLGHVLLEIQLSVLEVPH